MMFISCMFLITKNGYIYVSSFVALEVTILSSIIAILLLIDLFSHCYCCGLGEYQKAKDRKKGAKKKRKGKKGFENLSDEDEDEDLDDSEDSTAKKKGGKHSLKEQMKIL
jgi:hypothetical protein